jgi:hypothetical protein
MSTIDAMLDRQRWLDAVEACTDKGVTERPPRPGVRYEPQAATNVGMIPSCSSTSSSN